MDILINDAQEDWIIDRFKKEWYQYNADTIPKSVTRPDLIWLIAPWLWKSYPPSFLKSNNVVTTVHHVVPGKFNERDFRYRDEYTNAYHVPSIYTKELIMHHTEKPIHVIPFWYDHKIWNPLGRDECRNKLKLPLDKFIIGSFQRDTEGKDNISPKLEKGPDKFVDTVIKIRDRMENPENLLVLLGGWRRQYVMKRLDDAGIEYVYKERADMSTLFTMYGSLSLYICASRTEGGPLSILESSAMKVPIISTSVGIAPVVLHNNCIQKLPTEVRLPNDADVEYNYENVQNYSLENLKGKYLKMFKGVINRNRED